MPHKHQLGFNESQLIHGIATIDQALEHMPEYQVLGLLVQLAEDPSIKSRTAKLLLLVHQHALDVMDEAERARALT